MPIEKVLRAFAEENLDEDQYYPVCHGQAAMIKPLGLLVKKPIPIYKRPFAKKQLINIAVLENFVVKEKRQEFTETVNSIISKEGNLKKDGEEEEDVEEGIGSSR